MDELEAVNMLLRLIGSSPVNSLDSNHPDVANSKATLDRFRKSVQRQGWWFNTDYNVILNQDSSGVIKIPETFATVVLEDQKLIVRGGQIYDRVNQTSRGLTNVKAYKIVHILDWEDLPATAQSYCAYAAAVEFIRDELEDPNKQNDVKQSAAQELITLRNQDLEESRFNIFNKSRIVKARAGVRPYRSGRLFDAY